MTATGTATEAGSRGRVLPHPRLVDFMVCTTALAGGQLNGRLPLPVALLAGVVAAHRSFMFCYVDIPATALALAALVPVRSPGAA